jgi:aryl-alcohol dehydrogenase-like predicted oxidoreductase
MGNTDEAESIQMIHTALDAGINLVDTAHVYSLGESELIVGKALKDRRDEVVLVTKFSLPMGDDPNQRGGSPRWVKRAVEDHRFRTEQPPYSILLRGIEANMLPTAQRHGMGVLTFGPLSSGWLSGRTDPTSGHRAAGRGARLFDMSIPGNRGKLAAVEQLTTLAADVGMPLSHLAVAFVRSHPAVSAVLIGPRRPEHLEDLLVAGDIELDDDVLDRIDQIVPPGCRPQPRRYFL